MGEYILLDGMEFKLGTAESLYYARYDQLRQWVRDGRARKSFASLEPARYLEGDFRFRFPFPDEDTSAGRLSDAALDDYDRGWLVAGGPGLRGMIEHGSCHALISAQGPRAYPVARQLTVSVPCPLEGAGHPHLEGVGYVEIVAQRPIRTDAGAWSLWTVVRCPYCRSMARLDLEEARKLLPWLTQDDGPEVARRMLAGYEGA